MIVVVVVFIGIIVVVVVVVVVVVFVFVFVFVVSLASCDPVLSTDESRYSMDILCANNFICCSLNLSIGNKNIILQLQNVHHQ